MRTKLTWGALFIAATIVTTLYHVRKAHATAAQGFASTTIALGRFGEIDVFNKLIPPANNGALWLSLQQTNGSSDLFVQSNVWQPGGSTGWHTHPGHSLITVTAGTVTAYDGNDPGCAPHVYSVGMGFVDHGGGHVHIIRNEGDVVAQTIAVQLIPAGATRRIDVPAPGNCPF